MVDDKTICPILRTKLHRPPVTGDHIHRPRLLKLLNNTSLRPLTLVAAPAGYGKSTLLSCWLESCDCPSAWVSLDENDSDLRQFLTYFLRAIQTIFPHAVRETLTLLNAPALPPLSILVNSLINNLDQIDQDFLVVLDDFHRIKGKSVRELLTEMLHYPTQSMHIVLGCRRYPLMPLTNLRAKDQLIEIGMKDLCFTIEETRKYLKGVLGVDIEEVTARLWTEKTEGWVTALRLGAISMINQDNPERKMLKLEGTSMYFMDYFLKEVVSQQPLHVRNCLMETSILDRFCAPLCEAVCSLNGKGAQHEEVISGKGFIDFLLKANLFLISLDSENCWFRIHHLFQQHLQNLLKSNSSPSKIKKLHSRASKWFGKNGFVEDAIQHALAAGEITAAMRVLARYGHNMMNDQQWPRLERCLGMLPHDRIEKDPELLLFEAWLYHMRQNGIDMLNMQTCLEKVETLLHNMPEKASTSATQMKGHLDALRGFQLFMSADAENALKHTRSACENIPIHHKRARVFAHIFQTGAYQMTGDLETGLSIYNKEMELSINSDGNYHAMYLTNLNFIYWIDADLISLRQNSERSLKTAMDSGQSEAIALSLYFLGIACYHQNNLQIAEEKLTTMVQNFNFYHPVIFAHNSFVLALIYQSKGKISKAKKVCEDLMNYAIDTNSQDLLQLTQALNAELSLRMGHLEEASHWAGHFHAKPFLPPYYFYMPQLVLSKVLMAQDTKDSQQQAIDLLNQLNDFLASIHNNIFRIHVLALQAMHYDTRGEKPDALKKLTEALKLAEPGGFIRLFVDLGPQMSELLKQLASKNSAAGYIGKILAAFREDEYKTMLVESTHPTAHLPPLSTQPMVESLTNREMEILNKLAQRLRDKEIADQLYISPVTVKTHLQNIYQKLNASNRRQAVSISRDIGILK